MYTEDAAAQIEEGGNTHANSDHVSISSLQFFNCMAHMEKPYLPWSSSLRIEGWEGVVRHERWMGFERTFTKQAK